MKFWHVEVSRVRSDGSADVTKVGYLHEPTRADLDELEGEGWEAGRIGHQSLSDSRLGHPGADPAIIRAHATVVAAFLDRDLESFLSQGGVPPTAALREAESVRAAAADAGLTDLAGNLQAMIDHARERIAERQ